MDLVYQHLQDQVLLTEDVPSHPHGFHLPQILEADIGDSDTQRRVLFRTGHDNKLHNIRQLRLDCPIVWVRQEKPNGNHLGEGRKWILSDRGLEGSGQKSRRVFQLPLVQENPSSLCGHFLCCLLSHR